jgi:aminoglycoside 3-N-acetyltransferase
MEANHSNVNDVSGEARAIQRAEELIGGPVTFGRLVNDLRALSIDASKPILVHASLSALGWVAGGPSVVVDALVDAFGPSATLVMPTQSGDRSDPSYWRNPPVPEHWISIIRNEMPAFDPARVETRGMGRIAEAFRTHPDAIRGDHPTVSFAAVGPDAQHIVMPHPLAPQFGESSPLARLYEADATILMLGTNHSTNTSLHLAEHRATWENKPALHNDGAAINLDGKRTWITFQDEVANDDDFQTIGEAFAANGLENSGPVACTTARWMSMRHVVDFATTWMEQNR